MDTGHLLTLFGSAIMIAVTWGGMLIRVKVLERTIGKLEKDLSGSRAAQGNRIGALELWRSFSEGREGRKRRPSRVVPNPANEESSPVPADVEGDESGAA